MYTRGKKKLCKGQATARDKQLQGALFVVCAELPVSHVFAGRRSVWYYVEVDVFFWVTLLLLAALAVRMVRVVVGRSIQLLALYDY